MRLRDFFRISVIIGSLPVTLTNGTTADATQVMSDLNWIVNQVNANAAPLSNTALLNANNNFTAVQSGLAATAGANFPIASQVQNWSFNTLTSALGTNLITARIAGLSLTAYAVGQIFEFIPSQTNTGPSNITIDAAGSSIIFSGGFTMGGGEMQNGVPEVIIRDSTKFNRLNSKRQMLCVGASVAQAAGSTRYIGPGTDFGTDVLARVIMPFACTVRNLYVDLNAAPVGAETCIVTLMKNGVATALTVTITGANTTGNDVTHSVSYAANDNWSVRSATSGGAASVQPKVSFEMDS